MSNLVELKGTLQKMTPEFKKALPGHIPAEKFTRVLMTAVSNNARLAESSRPSLLAACMKLAEIGLMPDGREAAIVTFKNQAQAMPMVAGLLKMVRNSGELVSLSANPVYENDEFEYEITSGEGEVLRHKPTMDGERGEFTHAYAMAKTRDGGIYIEVMSKQEIEKIRAVSKGKDSSTSPWKTWYEQMAVKSVIRRLYKRLPSSADLDTAVYADDDMYEFTPPPVAPIEAKDTKDVTPDKKKIPSKLQAAIDDDKEDSNADDEELPI